MVVTLADVDGAEVETLLRRYGLCLEWLGDDTPVTGSFWGEPEAGVVGHTLFVRRDTPVHSLLHESCHVICMTAERRQRLDTDAGGDDLEEAAVCYLQIVLADEISGVGRRRLMADMDDWGYSFRLGDTRSWFERDAEDARNWLIDKGLLGNDDIPVYRPRH